MLEGNEMASNRILILTGGNIDVVFLTQWLKNNCYDKVIAVDRGLMAGNAMGLEMDYIVGDFDSVSEDVLNQYINTDSNIIRHKPEKDQSDSQLAMELAIGLNPSSIDLIGATGTRLDHGMANIQLLLLPLELDIPTYIIDTNNRIYLMQRDFVIQKEQQYGSFLSFLPLLGPVKGLKLEGVKYPLDGVELIPGSSLCISNEIMDDKAIIKIEDGVLLVFESKD